MSEQEMMERGARIREFIGTEGHSEYRAILMDRVMREFWSFLDAPDRDAAWESSIRGRENWSLMGVADEADLLGQQVRTRLEEAYAANAQAERQAAERTAAGRRLARLRPAASPLGGGAER